MGSGLAIEHFSAARRALSHVRGGRTLGFALAAIVAAVPNAVAREPAPRPSPAQQYLHAALADDYAALDAAGPDHPIPLLHEPKHIRSCCAFGLDLGVTLGSLRVPFYKYRTPRALDDLGPHEYAAGLLQFTPSPVRGPNGWPKYENNGIVYTCRGGFIDIGHLRDHADRTLFFAARADAWMETGGALELRQFGGSRRVVLDPVPSGHIRRVGRRRLAVAMGQWLAMQIAIWHEIGSWYGNSNVPFFPEKLSSFSMEDLYSNLVGTKLAGGILLLQSPRDVVEYDRAMTQWLPAVLRHLQIVSKEEAREAMRALDGIWWDSSKRLPDWKIVRRRKYDIGTTLRPWLVSMAYDAGPAPLPSCAGAEPLELSNADSAGGVALATHARLEIEVSESLVENGFPLPRPNDRRITNADFAFIVERIRTELAAELGRPSDHPYR